MKFVVTGTGRCGTGYMSKILTEAGLPCGHEAIYNFNGVNESNYLIGDSSWMAVPHLSKLAGTNTKVIHIYRNPLKVFRSWLFDQNNIISLNYTNTKSNYNHYLLKHYPDIGNEENQVDKAVLYYLQCNNSIYEACDAGDIDYIEFKVEDDPRPLIQLLCGDTGIGYEKYEGYNSRNKNIAGDKEVVPLLRESKYFNDLYDNTIGYYPELEEMYEL